MHLAILPKNRQIYNEGVKIVISIIDILGVLGAVVVMRAIPVERGVTRTIVLSKYLIKNLFYIFSNFYRKSYFFSPFYKKNNHFIRENLTFF